MREQDMLPQHNLEELKKEITLGIEQASQGKTKLFNAEGLKQRVALSVAKQA